MRLDTHEKKLKDILRYQETNQVNKPNNVTEIKDNRKQPKQIRSFRPHLLNPETENLIIGGYQSLGLIPFGLIFSSSHLA